MILLTEQIVEGLRTPEGGYNRATMDALGVGWPLSAGWKRRLVGMSVSDASYAAALKAKDQPHHFYRGNTRRKP